MRRTTMAAIATLIMTQPAMPQNLPAASTGYEQRIRSNASKFHKNFSAGRFDDNGPLVTPDIDVNSNNVKLTGRQNFIDRLKRYSTPFPGLQLNDRIRVVDGDAVATNYILQGEQKGPFGKVAATGNKIEAMSGEIFVFYQAGLMRKLITVTELDVVAAEVRGNVTIKTFAPVTLLPNAQTAAAYASTIKATAASLYQNYSAKADAENAALATPDVTINADNVLTQGRQAIVDRFKPLRSTFPDLRISSEYVLVDGNRAAVEYVMEGTQTGGFRTPEGHDVKPTGKTVRVRGMDFLQFDPAGHISDLVIIHNQDDFGTQLEK